MKSLFKFLMSALASWYAGYTNIGKFWLTLGLAALAVDAAISYQYGISQTTLHGLGFALVAIFFAFVPDQAKHLHELGKTKDAYAMSVAAAFLGVVALYSHLGYGAGVRLGDIQQTGFHNANLEGKQDNAVKLNEKIAFLEKRQQALDAELTRLVETRVGGWAVSVRPSSSEELDGAISAKELEAANEAKRRGCKAKCEARTNELAHLKALRAKAKEIEDNNRQHAAALEGLASARNEVAQDEYVSSSVVNQTSVAASLYKVFTGASPADAINPDNTTVKFANLIIAGGGALAFMIMAPVGIFIAGRHRRRREDVEAEEEIRRLAFASMSPAAAKTRQAPSIDIPPARPAHTTINAAVSKARNAGTSVWRELDAALSGSERAAA